MHDGRAEPTLPLFTASIDRAEDRPALQALLARKGNAPRTVFGHPAELRGPTFLIGVDAVWRTPLAPCFYVHGKAEEMLGFDLPILLEGAVEDVPEQPVGIVHPDWPDEILPGVLLIEPRPSRRYGLVVLADEIEETRRTISKVDAGR